MRITIVLIILLIALTGAISSWYFSSHEVAKRQVMATLETVSEATVSSQDQAAMFNALDQFFTPDGKITMNVKFSVLAIGSGGNQRGWDYAHNKQEFFEFLTEMIGKVDGYGMKLTLEELLLDESDESKFTATVHASGYATGASLMMGRSVGTRYVIIGDCSASGTITDKVQVSEMNCPITLRQQADLSSPKLKEAIQELKGLKP